MGIRTIGIAAALAGAVSAAGGCTVAVPGSPAADPAAVSRPAPSPRPAGDAFHDTLNRFDLVQPPGWAVDPSGLSRAPP